MALQNSVIVAISTALIATTLGTIAALALQRASRAVRTAFEILTYTAIIIPGIVIGIATLIFFVIRVIPGDPAVVIAGVTSAS